MSKARDLANFSDVAPDIGRKNLIINGAMQVAQRGTSFTGLGENDGGTYLTDRWAFQEGGTPTAEFTATQDSNAPEEFASSLKLACTTAQASLDSNIQLTVEQRIEAQNLQLLAYGTSAAKQFTLSFYVKSNKTGTYTIWMWSPDMSKQYSVAYTVDSADTWERKSIVVNGETANSINNDNGEGLRVRWHLAMGSDYTSGTLADTAWEGAVTANRAVGQVNLADSTSNYWQITGVQLEVGSVATPFEHRSYGEELALCQRYYYRMNGRGSLGIFHKYTGGQGYLMIHLPVTMRNTPSLESSTGTQYYRVYGSGLNDFFTAWAGTQGVQEGSFDKVMIYGDSTAFNVSSNGTSGWVQLYNTSAYVAFQAEL